MTETKEIWAHDTLKINDEGEVIGSAYTHEFKGGYDVSVGVISYEYKYNGETKMNHVPNVVVSDKKGKIIAEPYAHDSQSAKKALENAKNAAEYVYKYPEEFIE